MWRCDHCGLTVMACPDDRWARYYGVYPLWTSKSLVDRIVASPRDESALIELWIDGDVWAGRLREMGLLN